MHKIPFIQSNFFSRSLIQNLQCALAEADAEADAEAASSEATLAATSTLGLTSAILFSRM
jgi:hypothetical protein